MLGISSASSENDVRVIPSVSNGTFRLSLECSEPNLKRKKGLLWLQLAEETNFTTFSDVLMFITKEEKSIYPNIYIYI